MTRMMDRMVFTFSLVLLVACGGEEPLESETRTVDEARASARPETGRASGVGAVMPLYSATALDGNTWQLSEEKGVTMLNLWATWCGPCRYEIPALIQLQKQYGDQGLQVVGVSMDQAGMESQIDSFVRNAGINYKIVHDPQARLADIFDTTIIPTTALIDRNGTIVWYHAGIVSKDDPEMLEALESALATSQARGTGVQSGS